MSDAAATRQAYRSSPRRYAFLAAALAIAVLPMVLTGNYWQTNLTVCAINVLLALGLDFILGYAGQLNLGQSAFYGLGAYVSTLSSPSSACRSGARSRPAWRSQGWPA
jgi:ABC-type branched-subunit amino acid transport system permease subunit